MATAAFLRQGQTADTLALARILIADPEVFVQKGVGWMLRYAGEVDRPALVALLDEHAARMPRPMLSAAIEKFPAADRDRYRAGRTGA